MESEAAYGRCDMDAARRMTPTASPPGMSSLPRARRRARACEQEREGRCHHYRRADDCAVHGAANCAAAPGGSCPFFRYGVPSLPISCRRMRTLPDGISVKGRAGCIVAPP